MLSMSIPLWLVMTAAGVPTLCLLLLSLGLLRTRRKRRILAGAPRPVENPASARSVTATIHRQLLEQQIDTVFDGLMAMIEAERMKLHALITYAMPTETMHAPARSVPAAEKPATPSPGTAPEPDEQELPVAQQVLLLADEGLPAEEIAYRLGLSTMEVHIALKMHAGDTRAKGGRLEAVA
ncbi:hypothetical protein [Desulfatitalea alkaliphila]|uniref:Uncharacterized protein n=1 Tax=Desulfatitalea alkaliphila TaxID=2929485 RepID=A0AA41R4G1_9BACT|nr:hypothetical protein [Desulfatitalea alkaliphila]MCJ8501288.1 hypothetical protein [Desulfatitalea alkaliphila]